MASPLFDLEKAALSQLEYTSRQLDSVPSNSLPPTQLKWETPPISQAAARPPPIHLWTWGEKMHVENPPIVRQCVEVAAQGLGTDAEEDVEVVINDHVPRKHRTWARWAASVSAWFKSVVAFKKRSRANDGETHAEPMKPTSTSSATSSTTPYQTSHATTPRALPVSTPQPSPTVAAMPSGVSTLPARVSVLPMSLPDTDVATSQDARAALEFFKEQLKALKVKLEECGDKEDA